MTRLAEGIVQLVDGVVERGDGVRLHLEDGREILDFSAGIAVTSTGHSHPHVVRSLQDQAARIMLAQSGIVASRPLLDLADRLGAYLPERIDRIWIGSTGSEAIEAAVRLARQATGRPNIVAFDGGFHGRTMGAGSLTSSTTKVRAGMSPLMAGAVFAPFPNPTRYGWSVDECTDFALAELDHILTTISHPDDTAAFLVEAVQGEGGYIPGSERFFDGLRQRADEHGALLVLDEVQAGWGRTGKFWGMEHFGVSPDVVVMGKGMGSGFPISALAAPKDIMDRSWPGAQGGTFSGHPLGCAAALATLDVIEQEDLVGNAEKQGARLIDGIRAACRDVELVADVRGLGLMVGVEFRDAHGAPNPGLAARVQAEALERGLLVLTCGPRKQVVRLMPALVVQASDIDAAVGVWTQALDAAVE